VRKDFGRKVISTALRNGFSAENKGGCVVGDTGFLRLGLPRAKHIRDQNDRQAFNRKGSGKSSAL
jgi:hypothetical protein